MTDSPSDTSKPVRRWRIRLFFEPRDIWVGVFWNRTVSYGADWRLEPTRHLMIYVCLLPCLPILFHRTEDVHG